MQWHGRQGDQPHVSYTLNFTNDGSATGGVDYTDVLGDVLDDAAIGGLTVVPEGALTTATLPNGTLRILGSLAPNQTAQIRYTVKVKQDGDRVSVGADGGLRKDLLFNRLAPTGAMTSTCGEGVVVCTQNSISSWTLVKAAVPASDAYVTPGDVVT